ncbi:MAG: glycosyltransferase family 2 protein, partial [Chthonomonadales bacterium]
MTSTDIIVEAKEKGIPLLSVVIPVFNEAATIESLLERVLNAEFDKEIVLVDDGSTDGTRDVLRTKIEGAFTNVHVFYHDRNRGKGAAVRTGIEKSIGAIVLIQDADLEYDPKEYGVLLGPILDGRADVVFGSRFL